MATNPSTISPKLCGGMFVAIPTAMPEAPLTRRLGMRDGKPLVLLKNHHSLE